MPGLVILGSLLVRLLREKGRLHNWSGEDLGKGERYGGYFLLQREQDIL